MTLHLTINGQRVTAADGATTILGGEVLVGLVYWFIYIRKGWTAVPNAQA